MIVGALIFGVGCGSGLIVGWVGGTLDSVGDIFEPANIIVNANFPDSVTAGEPFDLEVVVTDTKGEDRMIQDIDFSGSFCDNMTVDSVTPTPNSMTVDPAYHEYVFGNSLSASQSTTFTFRITPNYDGVFTGDITVYVDSYSSEYTPVSFVVSD